MSLLLSLGRFHPLLEPFGQAARLAVRRAAAWLTSPAPTYSQGPAAPVVPGTLLAAAVVAGVLVLLGLAAVGAVSWYRWARERGHRADKHTRQQEALQRHFNPYIFGEPVRQASMFFGRDELLGKIINGLHQNSIMIHGERRIGKTSLLFHLAQRLRRTEDPEWVFIPVSVDLEGTSQDRFFYLLAEAVWGVVRAYLTGSRLNLRLQARRAPEYTDRDFASDLRVLLEPLKALVGPRKVRLVLLVDEMDVFNEYDRLIQQQFRRVFMSDLAQHLGAVVAGAHIQKTWDRQESPWYNMFYEIPLGPFTEVEARALLIEPVRDVYRWDEDAIVYVLERAQGRPHRLQRYALEAVNLMLSANRLNITLADVRAAGEAIARPSHVPSPLSAAGAGGAVGRAGEST